MMSKNVLFLAPSGLDIYKDVICELNRQGYIVDYVSSAEVPNNPFKPIFDNRYSEENIAKFESTCTQYWEEKFSIDLFSKKYDLFLSIDGLMVCPFLFSHLKELNPKIQLKLFLYDKIQYACHIERYFMYYDDVFSFDLDDCKSYGLKFLPIYWVPSTCVFDHKFDVFGMATYSLHKKDRALLFRQMKDMVADLKLKSFIKLYLKMDSWPKFMVKNFVKYLRKYKTYIAFSDVFNGLVTNKSLSPTEFRNYIYSSSTIIDTHVEYQDGLTARFMWALGAEKKIITTNSIVKQYNFYTPDQFFILGEDAIENLPDFLTSDFKMSEANRLEIKKYRIDNWLFQILN